MVGFFTFVIGCLVDEGCCEMTWGPDDKLSLRSLPQKQKELETSKRRKEANRLSHEF